MVAGSSALSPHWPASNRACPALLHQVTDGTGVVLGGGVWFLAVMGLLFRGLAGFFGCGGGWWGGFAVGVGWVYCFLSRREGDRRVAGS